MKARVLFYVQHLLGIGHLKRAEILAEAMAAAGLDVTIAYGSHPIPEVPFTAAKVAQLPPATIAGENFTELLDESSRPVDDAWRSARRSALLDLYAKIDPDVVLLELFPFGRRQFAFELIPILDAIHGSRRPSLVACSVRDVLVASKKPGREAEAVARARRYFDAVFVHGDPALIPFGSTFTAAGQIAELVQHTGYVAAASAATSTEGKDEVLVSAGGGAVGLPLLLAAVQARSLTPLAGNTWRFLTGPNFPDEDFERLSAHADANTIVERFRTDFSARVRTSALSISQAGYNTTMDILKSGARAVVVPYETEGETEQRVRAELLAERGLLTVVPETKLSPSRLAKGVADELKRSAKRITVDFSGAATTARLVQGLAARRAPARRS
jgi:predicted glycosyltransferase